MYLLNEIYPRQLVPYLRPYLDPMLPGSETWSSLASNPNYLVAFKYFCFNAGLFLISVLWGLALISFSLERNKGSLALSHLSSTITTSSLIFLASATGFALVITELFILSLTHLLDEIHVTALSILSSLAALACICFNYKSLLSIQKKWQSDYSWPAIIFFMICLVVYQFSTPRLPIIADATSLHVPYADFFLKHHGLAVNEQLIYPYHVFNINLLYSLALMINHNLIYVQSVHALFSTLIMLGIYAFCREANLKLFITLLIPFVFCMNYTTRIGSFCANVDLGGTFFIFSSVFALWLWQKYSSPTFLIISAICLGIGLGSKYILLIFPLPAALCLLYFGKPQPWRPFLTFAFWTFCFGSWWYIRNLIDTGNPVSPFAPGIFGYGVWTKADFASQMVAINNHWIPRSITGVLLAPWYAYQSDILRIQGPFPILMILFVSTAFAPWIKTGFNLLLCFAWIQMVSWVWGSQDPRHLLPIFPIVLVYGGIVANLVYDFSLATLTPIQARKQLHGLISFLTIIAVLTYGALNIRARFVFVYYDSLVPGKEQNEALSRNNPALELAVHANEVFNEEDTVYELGLSGLRSFIKANVVGNPFGPHGYWRIIDSTTHDYGGIDPIKLEKILTERYGAKGVILLNAKDLPYSQAEFDQRLDLRYRNSAGSIYTWKDGMTPGLSQ